MCIKTDRRKEIRVENYGNHLLQKIKIYTRTNSSSTDNTWVIFVHGGAWRDPKITYDDGDYLAEELLKKSCVKNLSCASVNYRLSPEVQHPGHLEDLLSALGYLYRAHGAKDVVLVGHSAGACLALQSILLDNSGLEDEYSSAMLSKVKIVIPVDGIYEFVKLVEVYPDYADFMEMAFGTDKAKWSAYDPGSGIQKIRKDNVEKIIVTQSPEDELLDNSQVLALTEALKFESRRVSHAAIKGSHYELVAGDELVDVVNSALT
jgi:kynurenine formamidase